MENVGFLHFIAQSDIIGKLLFASLVIMSVTTWSILLLKIIALSRLNKEDQQFLIQLSDTQKQTELSASTPPSKHQGVLDRITTMTKLAQQQYRSLNTDERNCIGNEQDFLIGIMQKNIKQEVTNAGSGLTVFATIAATAPFVGLFGTVWGVYHALIAIGSSGTASLDQIATPVGEALVMTGVGLAVAVPAVIAYNWLLRKNRSLAERLDAYIFDLLPLLLVGKILNINSYASQRTDT